MRAKWRKIIWAILAVQLLFVHLLVLQSWYLSSFLNRVTRHFGLFGMAYINWNKLAVYIWLDSACVIMGISYWSYLRFRKTCIGQIAPVSDPWVLGSLQKAIEETGLQKRYQGHFLYYNNDIREPFVMGFGRPVLLLPRQEYEREVLPLIFLHECYHIRHRDTLYKLFMLLMQSLLWFQPLMYLLKAVSFMDIEVACDEAVIEGKDMEARKAYGMALLNSLQKGKNAGQSYSAFFYHGAYLMRARIKAVMSEKRRWDYFAIAGIMILLMEVMYSGYRIGYNWHTSYQARQEELTAVIYDGYEIPESFTQAAADSMLVLDPVGADGYYNIYWSSDEYEEMEYEELPYAAEGPWQIRLKDADDFRDALQPLLMRYLYYYIDQRQASEWDMEGDYYAYPGMIDTVYRRWLAGSQGNAVFAIVFKMFVGNEEDLAAFPEPLADRAQFVYEQGSYYAYFDWTVRIRMVKDYVFELEGVAETREMLDAYWEKYPQADLEDVPELDLVYLADEEEIATIRGDTVYAEQEGFSQDNSVTAVAEQERTTERPWQISMDKNEDILWVSGADGIMQEVPVPLSEILGRGDGMNGQLTSLQEGSYQADGNKIIFAYGGSGYNPFSVVFYEEESGSFKKSIVDYDAFGGRMIFVDFPENSEEGFLIVTGERVVWQESTTLFHTMDGGKSWQEVGPAGPDANTQSHSLTVGAGFISNKVGFVTIRDSEIPDIWRTADGGVSWEKQTLPYVPEYYGMAYMPIEKDGVLTLYVGMEEYSEYGGTKAKYKSTDDGATWEYCGLVLRK